MAIERPQTGRYVNPYTDFGFKWLFGTEMNKELLIEFLNALLRLDSPIRDITYKNGENLGDTKEDRRAVFDVYCESENGDYFIVEMQREIQDYFVDRSIYYASFPIRDQAIKGENWDFNLKAVYTVGILDFTFKDENDNHYYHEVKLVDTTTEKVFYDKLTFVYLEMPKFNKPIAECDTILDKWMFVLKNMTRLMERPIELQQRIFKNLFETAEVAKFDEQQRAQYEESLKVYRDWNNVMKTKERIYREEGRKEGREEGRKEGREEGRKEGREEGREERALEIAKILKQQDLPIKQIIDATNLTQKEIERL